MSVRFAPSPTGKLHLGNLRTAWISKTFARFLALPWMVRFEDIDRPRVVPGALEAQLEDMRALGLVPDSVVLQSEHHARHEALFRKAVDAGQAYPCACSRKELSQSLMGEFGASAPHGDTPLYTGRCRDPKKRLVGTHPTLAWRFVNPAAADGRLDFVIGRTNAQGGEFAPSYHWACAIDDFDGRHTLLVRASDLVQASQLQARVYAWVASSERSYPAVFHTALLTANDGSRLEKRTRGITLQEILNNGMDCNELRRRFEVSFDPKYLTEFAPGKIWGERPDHLTLQDMP